MPAIVFVRAIMLRRRRSSRRACGLSVYIYIICGLDEGVGGVVCACMYHRE